MACLGGTPVEKLLPPDCGNSGEVEVSYKIPSLPSYDEFGEAEILPRIGGEYQAELPPLNEEFNHKSSTSTNSDSVGHSPENFVVGMPMLLTWVSKAKHDSPGSSGSSTSSDSNLSCSKDVGKKEVSCGGIGPSQDFVKATEVCENPPTVKKIFKFEGMGFLVVPGIDDEHWSPIEKDSFLLGLYIFEKNFVEVKQFVGTKEMGALQSYYYGKFYGSQEYRRWSQCRKMKSRKCIYGQRIFTGLRQQELLSRMLPKVSDECRNALFEVSKTFAEDKMSLSEYVSSLKAMVGMTALVEAVGIGTGKHDLTGVALESLKSNQAIPIQPEIPSGKACSSLTSAEIMKFLSGNYRLSKARSNDLFWEAVWPRLLARGWHSEQPRSKQCLVFLIPGVKKFSRSKLVKGDHYYDSVTDILSKVAREPELIELDMDGDHENKKSDEDDNDLPKKQRPNYLQPKTPNRIGIVLKFTVVDTSLCDGKLRELRPLPSELSGAFITRVKKEDSDEETSEDSSDVSDTIGKIMVDASATDKHSLKTTKSNEKLLPCKRDRDSRDAHTTNAASAPDSKNKTASKVTSQSKKLSKSQSSRGKKQVNTDHEVVPAAKHQTVLSTCSQKETGAGLENGITRNCCSNAHEVTENLSSQVGSWPDKLSSTSSSRGSPGESIENPHTQTLIDLNLPHIPPDPDNGTSMLHARKDQKKNSVKVDSHSSQKPSASGVRSEQQQQQQQQQPPPNVNPLRHSTRNRPPTSRALEALADGYLTVNRKRKTKDMHSQDAPARPSQRARGVAVRSAPNESTNSSLDAPQVDVADNGVSNNSKCNTSVKSQSAPQAKEEPVSAQCGIEVSRPPME